MKCGMCSHCAYTGIGELSLNPRWTCVSLCAKTLGKGMNPFVLIPNIGKLSSLVLISQPVEEKENSEFKLVVLF